MTHFFAILAWAGLLAVVAGIGIFVVWAGVYVWTSPYLPWPYSLAVTLFVGGLLLAVCARAMRKVAK